MEQRADPPRRRWVEIVLVVATLVELTLRLVGTTGQFTPVPYRTSAAGVDTTQTVQLARTILGALLSLALLARAGTGDGWSRRCWC